jgi:hypothetical protein
MDLRNASCQPRVTAELLFFRAILFLTPLSVRR